MDPQANPKSLRVSLVSTSDGINERRITRSHEGCDTRFDIGGTDRFARSSSSLGFPLDSVAGELERVMNEGDLDPNYETDDRQATSRPIITRFGYVKENRCG